MTLTFFSIALGGYLLWGAIRWIFDKKMTEKEKTDIKLGLIFLVVIVLVIYLLFFR